MKKLLGLIGVAVCAVAVSTSAQARDDLQFYVGADYQYLSPSWKSPNDSVLPANLDSGADIHVGMGFMSNFAAELGYMQSQGTRDVVISSTAISTKTTVSGPTFDVLGYLPFSRSNVYGIGTVGISELRGEAKISGGISTVTASKTEIGYRGGVGLEWRPNPRFGVRALVRYQSADFGSIANHAVVGSIGFNFYL